MKRKIFISLIISFITVLAYNVQAQAETTITRVTSNGYEDSFPCINDDYLVWQAYEGGDWEIKLYDMGTGETLTITDNDYNDVSPQTDGDYVVWFGSANQSGEIFLYEISSPTSENGTQITSNTDNKVYSPPQIADGRVVWTSHEVGDSVEPGEINLFEIGGSCVQLTENDLDDISPRINSEFVVWLQIDEDDNSTLFRYRLSDGTTTEAPEGFIWEDSPQTDGDLTVSMRNDGSDWEIIIRKDGENGFEQVTDNSMNDRYPSISGNNIAWMAGEGQASEIYIAQYTAAAVVCSLADFAADFGRTDCSGACECDCNGGDSDVDGSDLAMLSQN